MNRRMVWLPVFVAVVMVAAAVGAQQQRQGQRGQGQRGGGFGINLGQVAANESVQQEIVLTAEQREKLRSAMAELRPQGGGPQAMQDLSDEARQALMAKREAAAKQLEAKLAETLTPEQMKRVKEVWMQAMGVSRAVRQPDVAKALGITEDQLQKIGEVNREMMAAYRDAAGDPAQMTALRTKTTEKIEGMLSDEQKAEWKKMCGKPFDVTPFTQRQGRGRRTGN